VLTISSRSLTTAPGRSSIGVRSVYDADHGHQEMSIIDPVDHAVRAASGAVSIIERWPEALANPLGIVQQWTDDELVCRKCDRLREVVGELPPGGGRDDQFVSVLRHVGFLR